MDSRNELWNVLIFVQELADNQFAACFYDLPEDEDDLFKFYNVDTFMERVNEYKENPVEPEEEDVIEGISAGIVGIVDEDGNVVNEEELATERSCAMINIGEVVVKKTDPQTLYLVVGADYAIPGSVIKIYNLASKQIEATYAANLIICGVADTETQYAILMNTFDKLTELKFMNIQ